MKARLVLALLAIVLAGTATAPAQKFYTPDVTSIIDKYGCAGCHGGSGGMDVTPYASLMSTGLHAPVVVANDSNSVIVRKLKGTQTFGARMPFGGPYLTAEEIAVVVEWIMGGAKETATTADVAVTGVPLKLELMQNYPNPFNPTTMIGYQIPVSGHVRLTVFDLLGREVAVLVDERKAAGRYEVRFDGSGLSSGVYFYRIRVQHPEAVPSGRPGNRDLTEVRTLILLR